MTEKTGQSACPRQRETGPATRATGPDAAAMHGAGPDAATTRGEGLGAAAMYGEGPDAAAMHGEGLDAAATRGEKPDDCARAENGGNRGAGAFGQGLRAATASPATESPFLARGFSFFRSRDSRIEEQLVEYMPAREAARRRIGTASRRWLLFSLCLMFFLFLLWAALADLEETVTGIGQIIPSQRVQHIQNLEGGILREILVTEGQRVEKGALLLRIDNEQAGSLHRDAITKSLELQAAIARLRAEINETDPLYPEALVQDAPEILSRHNTLLEARRRRAENERRTLEAQRDLRKLEEQEQLARRKSLDESLAIAARQRDMAQKLMASRSYSEMDYLNMAQQVVQLQGQLDVLDSTIPKIRAGIREAEEKLLLHKADMDAKNLQELNEANAELATLREILIAGADRVTRTEVRSPVNGIIKRINITTEGGVIMPGEIIMDVVPLDDSLLVEARVSPQDIAFLFVGQKAKIRLTAYDFSIYGALDAELEHISADTIEGKQGEVFYLVRLRTARSTLEHNGQFLPILPGMMAQADIITGSKSVLDYLLKPILKARHQAMRER